MSEYQRKPSEQETAAPLHVPAPSNLPPISRSPSTEAIEALKQLHVQQRQHDLQLSVARFPEIKHQQTAPVLQALAVQRQDAAGLLEQQTTLQRQINDLQSSLPEGAFQAAVQRLAGPQPLKTKPSRPAEWVQLAQLEVQRVQDPQQPEQTRYLSTADMGLHKRTLQVVTQQLVQGFKADRKPPLQRYAEYGEQLATLQRQGLSRIIPRHFMTQIPSAERPSVQRAMNEALQRLSQQDAQDTAALAVHSLQRQLAATEDDMQQPVMARIQARRGSGHRLPESVQRHLEAGLNHDLSGVRIHDDAEADQLAKQMQAVAFTTGKDVYFRSGTFNPNTQTGLELIAHEVTHVKQQDSGQVGSGLDPDAGLESEAQAKGREMANSPIKARLPGKATRRPSSYRGNTPLTARHAVQRQTAPATSSPALDQIKLARLKRLVTEYRAFLQSGQVTSADREHVEQSLAKASAAIRQAETVAGKGSSVLAAAGTVGVGGSAVIVGDDITVVGVADDVALPFIWLAAGGLLLVGTLMKSSPASQRTAWADAQSAVDAAVATVGGVVTMAKKRSRSDTNVAARTQTTTITATNNRRKEINTMRFQVQWGTNAGGPTFSQIANAPSETGVTTVQAVAALEAVVAAVTPKAAQEASVVALAKQIKWVLDRPPLGINIENWSKSAYFPYKKFTDARVDVENMRGHNLKE